MIRKSLFVAAGAAMLPLLGLAQVPPGITIDGRAAALLERMTGSGGQVPPLTLLHADADQPGQVWRLATPAGDPWLLASAEVISTGRDGLTVTGLEAWRGGRPVLAAAEFRQLITPAAGELRFTGLVLSGRHGRLTTRLTAPEATVRWQAASPAELALSAPEGVMSAASGAGRSLDWVATAARFDGTAWHLQQFSAQFGAGLALVARSVMLRPDRNGGLFIEAEGLTASEVLTGRFRGLGGLRLPPVTLQAQLAPVFDRSRRWTATLSAGPASMRLAGRLTRDGAVSVTEIEAAGLLQLLEEAGASDPLLTAGRLGLFYDSDGALLPPASGTTGR